MAAGVGERGFGKRATRVTGPTIARLREAIRPGDTPPRTSDPAAEVETRAANLLRMFEESSKGWFWETDREGGLTYLTPSLIERLDLSEAAWRGQSFTRLLAPEENDDGSSERSLRFYLSSRAPFSDVLVRANAAEETWWSVSGEPIQDEVGRFFGFRGFAADLTEQRRSEVELNRLARFDSLTGLANREMMRRFLDDALWSAARKRHRCALFLLDLDRFKIVNDTLGHPAGDTLLKLVSLRLQEVMGHCAHIGRIGGDEFQAVFPEFEDKAQLAKIADQIIERVSLPYSIGSNTVSVGTSIGIAVSDYDDRTAADLVRDADLALYAAKDAGKGVHRFFDPTMHDSARDRQQLEADLIRALEEDELSVLFQPTVNTETERVVGFEALARWHHPTRGPISPVEFIPLAEERGLIGQLGETVLRKACAEAAKWPGHVKIAVNISPVQFASAALPTTVANILSECELPAERLELEITEGALLNHNDAVQEAIRRLKAIGVRLALDDFGTGYSSLGYLLKVPFDKIKVDQSFVRGASIPGSKNSAIIRTVVNLAKELSMETTAEGVETHDDLSLMKALGCTLIQGYIYGKPMPAEEAAALINSSPSVAAEGFVKSRPERTRLLRNGTIIHQGRSHAVRLRNISAGGAMFECALPLEVGTEILLDIGSGDRLAAEVRWSRERQTGVQFKSEINVKELTQRLVQPAASAEVMTPTYLRTMPAADEGDPRSQLRAQR